MENDVEDIFI
jgi:hypothetical protein